MSTIEIANLIAEVETESANAHGNAKEALWLCPNGDPAKIVDMLTWNIRASRAAIRASEKAIEAMNLNKQS